MTRQRLVCRKCDSEVKFRDAGEVSDDVHGSPYIIECQCIGVPLANWDSAGKPSAWKEKKEDDRIQELTWMDVYDIPWFDLIVESILRRPPSFGLSADASLADARDKADEMFFEYGNAADELSGTLSHYLEQRGYIEPPTHHERRRDTWDWMTQSKKEDEG